MPNYLTQNNVEGAVSIGIAGLVAGYCYSFGWSALSGVGLMMTAGMGTFALFKVVELCIALKNLVDSCNDTVMQVNQDLITKAGETIQKANELAGKLESTLDTISAEMLPEVQRTLTNVQDMTEDAKIAVKQASTKVDEMLSGQMVLQLGTASVRVDSEKSKPVKPH